MAAFIAIINVNCYNSCVLLSKIITPVRSFRVSDIYKKIKKQNGEAFAQELRNYHNGLLEIPGIENIVRHAGQDASVLLPYLMSLLASNDDHPQPSLEQDPFVLLDQAGYNAFYADTLEKQNSIEKYFQPGELLCTFNDNARYQRYHIVHAIKKDVDHIKRSDFKGVEKRQDAYGTSVISIQMLKKGGFISIKNRYNHAVDGCDNTFSSNPNNIAAGLSSALKTHFNVDFSASEEALPEGFTVVDGQIFQYHNEVNNFYYGDQAWAEDGVIHTADRSAGDALFDIFLFDNKNKMLRQVDTTFTDCFVSDFNDCYGGNPGLTVKNGNLYLDDQMLIGAENSRIKTLYLPGLTVMSDRCLRDVNSLKDFNAPDLTSMGKECFYSALSLTSFNAPALTSMEDHCLRETNWLTHFDAPNLISMAHDCFYSAMSLTHFNAPALIAMEQYCLWEAPALTDFSAVVLVSMEKDCLKDVDALLHFNASALTRMSDSCLYSARSLVDFNAPALISMGNYCLHSVRALVSFNSPVLTIMGDETLSYTSSLANFNAPALGVMGEKCLYEAPNLKHFNAPALPESIKKNFPQKRQRGGLKPY